MTWINDLRKKAPEIEASWGFAFMPFLSPVPTGMVTQPCPAQVSRLIHGSPWLSVWDVHMMQSILGSPYKASLAIPSQIPVAHCWELNIHFHNPFMLWPSHRPLLI